MNYSINKQIADQLEILGRNLSGKDFYRARAYFNAAEAIRRCPQEITSGSQAKRDIKGVGKTVSERIDEFLNSGTVMLKVRNEPADVFEHAKVIELFTKIYGVGPVTAEKWYQTGYRSLEQLAKLYPDMNRLQQLGYKYYLQLELRIPRSEIDQMKTLFDRVLPDKEFLICGSYRRGHRTSGDIDLLIKDDNPEALKEIVDRLIKHNFVLETLALKNKKFMGIVSLSSRHNARRLDIMITHPNIWGAAVLYFTGSKELNVKMRELALSRGMRLNEYGIWKASAVGELEAIPTRTEKDIFDILNMAYLEPEDRDI